MDVEVLEPRTVEEAAALRGEHGEEAKLLAGGTALVLMLRNRLVAPRYLISLNTLDGLRDVGYEAGKGLRMGALATIAQAERAAAVREHYPALAGYLSQGREHPRALGRDRRRQPDRGRLRLRPARHARGAGRPRARGGPTRQPRRFP